MITEPIAAEVEPELLILHTCTSESTSVPIATLTCAIGRTDLEAKASIRTPIIAPAKTTKIGESNEYESVGEINSLIYLPP